jgi:thioredoxin-like negative regulator of GroEL
MDSRALDATRLLAHALLGSGKYATARDLLRGVVAAAPDDQAARRGLVHTLLCLGEYEEAEPLTRELAKRETGGDGVAALFFHAHALWGCGRTTESRAVIERYAALLEGQPVNKT